VIEMSVQCIQPSRGFLVDPDCAKKLQEALIREPPVLLFGG
jgi:hypothetical protein